MVIVENCVFKFDLTSFSFEMSLTHALLIIYSHICTLIT